MFVNVRGSCMGTDIADETNRFGHASQMSGDDALVCKLLEHLVQVEFLYSLILAKIL